MSRDALQLKELVGRDASALQEIDVDAEHDPEVARRASNASLAREAVQMKAGTRSAARPVHAAAERGMSSPAQGLPHADRIQAAFGRHDVSHVQAHVDPESANAIGAEAYATGDHVVFEGQPDLHTAAHEAAHVVQQRAGVHLYGGVGQAGDTYERQADAVADRVVAGESAEDLLGPVSASSGAQSQAVQRKEKDTPKMDHDESSIFSRLAVSGSLKLLAKHFHEAARELVEAVNGPHDTPAGTGPAMNIIPAIFNSLMSEATHVSGLITSFGLEKHYLSSLAPEVKLVLGAYTRFHPAMERANGFMSKEGDKTLRNPYWIKQIVDGMPEKIVDTEYVKLEPDVRNPDGTEAQVESAVIDQHFEAAHKAVESAENGNTGDAQRISKHVAEIASITRDDKSEMKSHKKQVTKLTQAIQALVKSHPDLKTQLEPVLKQLKAL